MTEETEKGNREEQVEAGENASSMYSGSCPVCGGTGTFTVRGATWERTTRCPACGGKGRLRPVDRRRPSRTRRMYPRIGPRGGGGRPYPPQRWPAWSRGIEQGFYPDMGRHLKKILTEIILVEAPQPARREKQNQEEIDRGLAGFGKQAGSDEPAPDETASVGMSSNMPDELEMIETPTEMGQELARLPVQAEGDFDSPLMDGELRMILGSGWPDVLAADLNVAELASASFDSPLSEPAVGYINSSTSPLATQINYDVVGMDVVGETETAPLEPEVVPLDVMGFSSNIAGG